jgi:glycosyltransferase involved in cell wall biosynthesis
VGNYVPDAQTSMHRFASMMAAGLAACGVAVAEVAPRPTVPLRRPNLGIDKWIGYADKFLLFPRQLRRLLREHSASDHRLVVHICDHSNAGYVGSIRHLPHVVTCHDLLAVRAARGEFTQTATRWSGRQLQASILRGLRSSRAIVCDSNATRADVLRLVCRSPDRVAVIPPGVSNAFRPAAQNPPTDRVRAWLATGRPYLLHVGGNQWYKNREGLLAIYSALGGRMADVPALVVAGKPLSSELRRAVTARGLGERVIEMPDLTDGDLAALYRSAGLLLFPSWAEGFGWPILEAMACRCRVVVSRRPPLTEIGADAPTYFDPADIAQAAATVATVLAEPEVERQRCLDAGSLQAAGFSRDRMVAEYVSNYRGLLAEREAGAPAWAAGGEMTGSIERAQ